MKRSALKRGKPLKASSSLKRSRMRRKPTEEPQALTEARRAVQARCNGRCEIGLRDCRGAMTGVHHRRLRRHGDHQPESLLAACNNCHEWVQTHPRVSYAMGWMVKSYEDPAVVPVLGLEHLGAFL